MNLDSREGFVQNVIQKVRRELDPSVPDAKVFKYVLEILLSLSDADLESLGEIQDSFCHRCGDCCRISKYVRYSKKEIEHISSFLSLSLPDFLSKFEALEDEGTYLITGRPCPFLSDLNFCRIYEIRPKVCREFPMGYSMKRLRNREPPFLSFCKATVDLVASWIIKNIQNTEN